MPNADHFIQLGMYLPGIIIILAALILQSLMIWWDSGSFTVTNPKRSSEPRKFLHLARPYGDSSFTYMTRQLYLPMLSMVVCHLTGMFFMHFTNLLRAAFDTDVLTGTTSRTQFMWIGLLVTQQMLVLYLIPLIQRLFTGSGGASNSRSHGAWVILKCMLCGETGLMLVALSTLNPSLALIFAVVMVPLFAFVRPCSGFWMWVRYIALLAASPPVIALAAILITQDLSMLKIVRDAIFHWDLYGGMLLPWITLFFWPMTIVAQVIVGMQV